MNQKSVLSYLIFLFSISSFAQTGFDAGILAGINASQVNGDGYSGFKKAGILVGLYTNVSISEKFNLQLEINYSEKGSRRNPKTSEGDTEFFLMRMNYINVPIMVQYEKDKFIYELGIYGGQLINDELENENGPFEIPPEFNQFKEQDYGALIGINFNFTDNLLMNWRFSTSVIPFRKFNSGESFQFDAGMMHHYLSFSFKYQFIGKNEG